MQAAIIADDTPLSAGRRSGFDRLILFLATGLGTGRIPVAPGTFGSLVGLPVAWGTHQVPFGWRGPIAAAFFLLGIPICRRAAEVLKAKDPGSVVFDEIAAFPVLFLFAPFTWKTAIAGFVLFRLFDITKPWPCRRLEKLPGGWGIMADDLIAGVYAGAALWCIARWLPLV